MKKTKDETLESSKELIKEVIKEVIKEHSREIFEYLKKEAWERIERLVKPEILKLALNYEEKYTQNYTAKEMIQWFKENYRKGYYGCVYMEKFEDDCMTIYKLHHLLIDIEKKEPCLDGSYPYRVVKTLKLDDDIRTLFKDKNMIILK